MEEPEYKAKDVPVGTGPIQNQLNDMHKKGYEFVTVTLNHVIYKKIKKHKKD